MNERQADARRHARLQMLLAAQRDSLPVAATLALQVSLQVGRVMARLGAKWRAVPIRANKLSRCLKADNVTIATVDEVAAALGYDAVLVLVPRWGGPSALSTSINGSTYLSTMPVDAHPAATPPTGAMENGE